MALSAVGAHEIAKILRKHVAQDVLEQIMTELVEVLGDKDFRDTIESLVLALGLPSER